MTAAQQFGDHPSLYYEHRFSPPVSPKSQPHGSKRKASTQDDELEKQNLISNSFKKLRLSKSIRQPGPTTHVLSTESDNAKRPSPVDISPVGVSYRDVQPSNLPSVHHRESFSHNAPYSNHAGSNEDDFMPVDDTADRIWVHDLDAEIAEIEAEEARERERIQLSGAGSQYAKIPDHLLKQNNKSNFPAPSMQMVLYRDPISISVPEEADAVRKTIMEARRRVRERQLEGQGKAVSLGSSSDVADCLVPMHHQSSLDSDTDMDLD